MELYPGCYQKRLPAGLQVIGEEIPTSKSVSLGLWFDSGSRDEEPDQNGITHLIEHLVFRGTSNRSAYGISSAIDRLGGRINGGTGREYTVFYVDLIPEGLEGGLDLLADLALNPLFNPDDLELERGVVVEEIRSARDDPQSEAFRLFQEALWGSDSGLSLRVTGNEYSVKGISAAQIKRRFDQMRRGPNMMVAAAGAFDFNHLVDLAADYFQRLEEESKPDGNRNTPQVHWRDKREDRDINQSHLCIGVEGLPKGDEDRYVLEILSVILGNGMSSRLFRKIRKELGLAYHLSSTTEYYSDTGLFAVYLALDRANVNRAKDLVVTELKDLQQNPVSDEELELAKKKTKGNLVLGLESNQANMVRLGGSLVYREELKPVEDILNEIEKITKDEIQNLASRLFSPDRLSGGLIGPSVSELTLDLSL